MQGTRSLLNRTDRPAATGWAILAPATAGAMKPRPVPPAAAAERLALIGEFAVAEKFDYAHVNPGMRAVTRRDKGGT